MQLFLPPGWVCTCGRACSCGRVCTHPERPIETQWLGCLNWKENPKKDQPHETNLNQAPICSVKLPSLATHSHRLGPRPGALGVRGLWVCGCACRCLHAAGQRPQDSLGAEQTGKPSEEGSTPCPLLFSIDFLLMAALTIAAAKKKKKIAVLWALFAHHDAFSTLRNVIILPLPSSCSSLVVAA